MDKAEDVDSLKGCTPCNVEACHHHGDESDTSYCKLFGFTDLRSCKMFIAWNDRPTPQSKEDAVAVLKESHSRACHLLEFWGVWSDKEKKQSLTAITEITIQVLAKLEG